MLLEYLYCQEIKIQNPLHPVGWYQEEAWSTVVILRL